MIRPIRVDDMRADAGGAALERTVAHLIHHLFESSTVSGWLAVKTPLGSERGTRFCCEATCLGPNRRRRGCALRPCTVARRSGGCSFATRGRAYAGFVDAPIRLAKSGLSDRQMLDALSFL